MKSLKPLSSTYLFNLYDKTAHLNDIMLKLIKDSVFRFEYAPDFNCPECDKSGFFEHKGFYSSEKTLENLCKFHS